MRAGTKWYGYGEGIRLASQMAGQIACWLYGVFGYREVVTAMTQPLLANHVKIDSSSEKRQ